MTKVDLVLFGCEYRQNRISKAYRSLSRKSEFSFDEVAVSWDGSLSEGALSGVQADYVLRSVKRRGYVRSILRWLRFTDSDYFFWLEDDWEFRQSFSLRHLVDKLEANENWIQIRLSKRVLLPEERKKELAPGIFRSESVNGVRFSANPCLCRTEAIKTGFREMMRHADDQDNFEFSMTEWIEKNDYLCAVLDPGDEPTVEHRGKLEYTDHDRWHAIGTARNGSEDGHPKIEIGTGNSAIPLKSRIAMVFKLIVKMASLSARQLSDDKAYRLSQTIYQVDDRKN